MERFKKHLYIGLRWIVHGVRLFRRNPWMLGGMGATASAVLVLFHIIPLFGGLLTALVAPLMLASVYLVLDPLYHNRLARLPAELRVPALKQAPHQLLQVFRDEAHLLPTVVAGVLSLGTVLLVHLVVRALGGRAWLTPWQYLDAVSLLILLGLGLIAFAVYLVIAAALIYALPLLLLREYALAEALRQSLKASRHFAVALTLPLVILLLPFTLAVSATLWSSWLGYPVLLVLGATVYPLVAASLYCSYQDIFRTRDLWQPADRRRRTDVAGSDGESLHPL